MERVTSVLKRDKIKEILSEISRSFRLPLAITDMKGAPFLDAAESGTASEAYPGQLSSPVGSADYPLCCNGERIGTITAPTSVENLPAVAYCIENSLRLETENLDLSAEVVRIYEEQAEKLHFSAHKLKGPISNLGDLVAGEILLKLELMGSSGDLTGSEE